VKSDDVATIAEIKAVRDGYRAIGKDPSPYRLSQEALLRRVLQGKGLCKINTVVDANSLISLRSRHSVGSMISTK
jgi:DNA/RNA-binding domain of Phe-tRNA-synthetase-like protein